MMSLSCEELSLESEELEDDLELEELLLSELDEPSPHPLFLRLMSKIMLMIFSMPPNMDASVFGFGMKLIGVMPVSWSVGVIDTEGISLASSDAGTLPLSAVVVPEEGTIDDDGMTLERLLGAEDRYGIVIGV
jgi:hypothetical protein